MAEGVARIAWQHTASHREVVEAPACWWPECETPLLRNSSGVAAPASSRTLRNLNVPVKWASDGKIGE
jgi:hypothetical protein